MNIEKDKATVEVILEATDSMVTASVCHMYLELYNEFQYMCEGHTDKKRDNLDRPDSHSIAGGANDPSETQIEAFKKDNPHGN